MEIINITDNNIHKEILKLFVNEYTNIDEISIQLNISESEIISVLDKYQDIINKCIGESSIQNVLII